MADLVKVTIDGREALVPKGTVIVEAAKQVGIQIPVFCYHEKMHPVGACRMCLVEIEKVPKPQAACTTPVADGMVVKTDTPMVKAARGGVLEFLLTNHPLDCPVCDKGGECPLQDTTFEYGKDRGRFAEEKRHFEKPVALSSQILIDRERCIMCTRCVRFQREIAGDEALTIISRGWKSHIGTLPGRSFDSPFSGNTIELCPVGALTSAQFRFRARSWEVKKTPSVCSMCSVGCNINVGTRAGKVLRVTSRENVEVDDGWLCDHGRFGQSPVDDPNRLSGPMVKKNGALAPATWDEALDTAAQGLLKAATSGGAEAVGGLISPESTNEELFLFQKLFRTVLKSGNLDHGPYGRYSQPEGGIDAATGSIMGLESARAILLANCNPLAEQPVLYLRLRKAATKRGARLISISPAPTGLTGLSNPWMKCAEGGEAIVVKGLINVILSEGLIEDARARLGEQYESVMMDVAGYMPEQVQLVAGLPAVEIREAARLLAESGGAAVIFPRPIPGDSTGLQEACFRLAKLVAGPGEAGGLFPLGTDANSQGAIDMGILPNLLAGQKSAKPAGLTGMQMLQAAAEGQMGALYVAGLDPVGEGGEEIARALSGTGFLVVQDRSMTPTAKMADVVLPGLGFAEKEGTLTNLERRVQRLSAALPPRGDARADWRIITDLANVMGAGWRYEGVGEVFAEIVSEVSLYQGLQYERLGPRGERWRYPGEGGASEQRNGRTQNRWYQPVKKEVQETGA